MRTLSSAILIFAYWVLFVTANVGFKKSVGSSGWLPFLQWQVVGNLAGFGSVLALTWLLRYIPLHLALAFTAGLGFVAVQVIAARTIFHESITAWQWLGVALVSMGIVTISLGR